MAPWRRFMFLGYMDDSGRFDNKKQTYQVLSTVLVPDKFFQDIETVMGICLLDLLPEEKEEAFQEFHAWELYGGYGVFDGIDQAKRFGAIKNLLTIVRDYKVPVVYGAVDVPKLQQSSYGSANPLDIAFRICLKGVSELMEKQQYDSGPEFALLIADDANKEKHILRNTFRQLRKRMRPPDMHPGTWYIHDDMYFGNSKDSVGIQLADLCSYFIGKHLENDEAADGFYQIFSDLIVHWKVEPE